MDKEAHSKTYSKHLNEHIYNKIPTNKKVLDVGCNSGLLGKKLIKNKRCIVYGIDYSKEAIKEAKNNLDKAEVFDLESYKTPFKKDKFDIIIFADVLEHLRYPELTLKNFSSLLKDDGYIIASIPNVANLHVRLKLLFGRWDLTDSGILDKTHLRFFTRMTIIKLFREANYKIIGMDSTPGFKFIFFRHFKLMMKIKEKLCKLNPKLFSLQFIVTARPIN